MSDPNSDPGLDLGSSGDDDWVSQMLAESLLGEHDPIDLRGTDHQGGSISVDGSSVTKNAANGSSAHPPPSHRPVATISDRPLIDDAPGTIPDDAPGDIPDNTSDDIEVFDGEAVDNIDAHDVVDVAADAEMETAEGAGDGGDGGDTSEPDDDDGGQASFGRFVAEWVVVLVGAVAFALVLRVALFQAFWIPSESMETTLQLQDRVLVNKLSYRLHDVNRGDVVVFRRPDDEQAEIRDLIKRVIGLPGDVVEGRDNSVWINGQRLEESYLADDEVILPFGPITVEDGHVFVMGDNRDMSLDSRFFGTVPEERIVGRAFVLFWPLDRIGFL